MYKRLLKKYEKKIYDLRYKMNGGNDIMFGIGIENETHFVDSIKKKDTFNNFIGNLKGREFLAHAMYNDYEMIHLIKKKNFFNVDTEIEITKMIEIFPYLIKWICDENKDDKEISIGSENKLNSYIGTDIGSVTSSHSFKVGRGGRIDPLNILELRTPYNKISDDIDKNINGLICVREKILLSLNGILNNLYQVMDNIYDDNDLFGSNFDNICELKPKIESKKTIRDFLNIQGNLEYPKKGASRFLDLHDRYISDVLSSYHINLTLPYSKQNFKNYLKDNIQKSDIGNINNVFLDNIVNDYLLNGNINNAVENEFPSMRKSEFVVIATNNIKDYLDICVTNFLIDEHIIWASAIQIIEPLLLFSYSIGDDVNQVKNNGNILFANRGFHYLLYTNNNGVLTSDIKKQFKSYDEKRYKEVTFIKNSESKYIPRDNTDLPQWMLYFNNFNTQELGYPNFFDERIKIEYDKKEQDPYTYFDPNYSRVNIGYDFRREKKKKNEPFGFEFRMMDYFDPIHLKQILRLFFLLAESSNTQKSEINPYHEELVHKIVFNVLFNIETSREDIEEYVNKINGFLVVPINNIDYSQKNIYYQILNKIYMNLYDYYCTNTQNFDNTKYVKYVMPADRGLGVLPIKPVYG
jgi:hypothetical protein